MLIHHKLLLALFAFSLLTFTACGDDDVVLPEEPELITTVTLSLTPAGGGDVITATYADIDGPDGLPPVISSLFLAGDTEYNGVITLSDQSGLLPVDITEEVAEEDDEHQFFFTTTAGLNLTFAYADQDDNGQPVGLSTTFTTAATSTGNLTITLRHKPEKTAAGVAAGDLTNAGGETDVEVTFPVTIQ